MGGDFSSTGGRGGFALSVFTEGFKARMIQRMAGVEGISASALSQEMGVSQPTLSRWLRQAGTLEGMKKKPSKSKARSSRQWTAEEKLRVVLATAGMSEEELGAYLRQEGLYPAQLDQWRLTIVEALAGPNKEERKAALAEARKIKKLEKEIRVKDKALAEVTALLVLKKKLEALMGDGDESTPMRRGT